MIELVERTKMALIHCIAECQDCDTSYGYYKNAQSHASRHAKKTGHTVKVEVGLAYTYNPKR